MQNMHESHLKNSRSGEVLMSDKNRNYTPDDIERELEKLYPEIFRMVSAMIWGSGLDAEDITQDVFLKAYRKASGFNRDSALSTWVYRIAKNTVIDALRKKKIRSIITGFWSGDEETVLEPNIADTDENLLEQRELQQLVRKSIAELPEIYRTIIVMREIEELPYAQISEINGESEGTLKSRLFHAKKKLREILIAKGIHHEIE